MMKIICLQKLRKRLEINKMLLSVIGHYSLILGLCFSLLIIFLSIKNFKNSEYLNTKILFSSFFQLILVSLSFLCLVFSFVFSDFSNETVFNNSHTTKPLFYKISGTWGNHEGSMLLWISILSIYAFFFSLTKNINLNFCTQVSYFFILPINYTKKN